MFKKFFDELLLCETEEQITDILYRADGVDMAFQREKINWRDHERLFKLAGSLSMLIRLMEQEAANTWNT